MYRQWAAAKRDYPDVLLLFRMGDFYEMFDEDARRGAEILGLTLTSRKYAGDKRIAMCGVPHHALDRYLTQLVAGGHRAAICEQVQDPREAKGLVERKVTRVITPGTLMEDELLRGQDNNFLLALDVVDQRAGIAVVDVSTGDFLVTELPLLDGEHAQERVLDPSLARRRGRLGLVADEIARLQPAELLASEELASDPEVVEAAARAGGAHVTPLPPRETVFTTPAEELTGFFGVDSLRGFGCQEMPAAQAAAARALAYLQRNRMDALPHLAGIATYSTDGFMVVDAATRRNLELVGTLRDGSREGSLLGLLDRTRTPMGARLIRQWLLQPLLDVGAIGRRLDAVEALVRSEVMAGALEQALRGVRDLERLTNRTTAGTANARDLVALRASIEALPAVAGALGEAAVCEGGLLAELRDRLDGLGDVGEMLAAALLDEPPAITTEGNLIRDGFSPELDELRDAMLHGREWIARLQDQERARTGVESLKVSYNRVFGYYIEVSRANQHLVPEDYTRKQTLVNAERFVTPGLKEMEEKILGAEERSWLLEYSLFAGVREQVAGQAERILRTARVLAQLDALLSLARVAVDYGYCRPVVDGSDAIHIREGRHPVVERTTAGEMFVPNDALLDCRESLLLIVTGPNMAGKSTYLRQVALICLLAQMGSFVPAAEARLGVLDRIFTRVGASDDLATGQSTFMVEMTETANILHHATGRSLIVLDEIGRGTSTFDGLSIAWAVAEHVVNRIGAKTLFATHYHHLNELTETLPKVKNLKVAVREQGEDIIFLRKIVAGGTDRSYGIQVARLAGLPGAVIERAREILRTLEREDVGRAVTPSAQAARKLAPTVQLTLFEAAPDPAAEALRRLDVDSLTPLEALVRLKELQDLARGSDGA
jgi:DNA mismatch repair protein MutS